MTNAKEVFGGFATYGAPDALGSAAPDLSEELFNSTCEWLRVDLSEQQVADTIIRWMNWFADKATRHGRIYLVNSLTMTYVRQIRKLIEQLDAHPADLSTEQVQTLRKFAATRLQTLQKAMDELTKIEVIKDNLRKVPS